MGVKSPALATRLSRPYPAPMSKRIAFLFSGQGAQTVGMGKDLAARFPAVAALFQQADEVLGRAFTSVVFEGPEADLVKTANCQPALYVHGLACLAALRAEIGDIFPPHAAAGLSLGEFTAHAAAGTFTFANGLRLVAERGRLMQLACESTTGAMAAMIGGEEDAIRTLAAECDVDVANFNSHGQIVLSGEAAKIDAAVEGAKDKGVRKATRLNVAGAYHSRLMQTAADALAPVLAATPMQPPSFPILANVIARPVHEPAEIRAKLAAQVTGSVRWTETIEHLVDVEKIDLFLELGPGGILAGLVRRIRKDTPVLSVSDGATLDAALLQLRAI